MAPPPLPFYIVLAFFLGLPHSAVRITCILSLLLRACVSRLIGLPREDERALGSDDTATLGEQAPTSTSEDENRLSRLQKTSRQGSYSFRNRNRAQVCLLKLSRETKTTSV